MTLDGGWRCAVAVLQHCSACTSSATVQVPGYWWARESCEEVGAAFGGGNVCSRY